MIIMVTTYIKKLIKKIDNEINKNNLFINKIIKDGN